ncbi:polyketide synthase dehydratase domain-containing protein, partial [Mycobacterium alsense]|uniref:polyketide synthase dehydratase domain-containing protein n=1 Tax=Mycobacterium alsense TaxID=324058 RepID=UPI000AD3959B
YDRVVERLAAGECTFVELSPHPVLAPAITDTLAQATGRTQRTQSGVVTTLHRDHSGRDSLATALGQLHNHGHSPSWSTLYPHARAVGLPTYPFEHRRYWLIPAAAGDASGLGQDRAEHPLLGAVVDLADQDQVVLTGRLSTATQGWLAGHQVRDTVLFPATGFIDLVLQAGENTGCPVIDELVLHTPMRLSGDAPADVQVAVHSADDSGRRAFSVHSRTGGQSGAWTLHASGELSPYQPAAPPLMPAPGVEAVDRDDFYERLAQLGYRYGGVFRSLRGIGTDPARPDVVHAEVELPAGTDVAGYEIHPALLDAALHAIASALDRTGEADPATLRLPYAFGGIALYATAATQLHVQLSRAAEDIWELRATDPTGAPVITIRTITLRELPDIGGQVSTVAGLRDSLFQLSWPPLLDDVSPTATAPEWAVVTGSPDRLPAGLKNGSIHADLATVSPCPELAIWLLPEAADTADPVEQVHGLTRDALAQLQGWLARTDTAQTRLVVVTRNAVSVSAFDGVPDLAHAAVWALIHTAQNEHPDRITVLDTDDTAASRDNLLAVAAARPAGEPQLALRNGVARIPRLARTPILAPPDAPGWQLGTTRKGDLSNLALLPTDPPNALAPGQIRVQVRAAGLNFRDVVVA